MTHDSGTPDLELLLRRIIREETGLTPVAPAEKWRGGELVLKPGKPGVQEKSWPIESFFHKVVMLRNRLRTLEQQINASDLPGDQKLNVQATPPAVTDRSPASTCCLLMKPTSSSAPARTDRYRTTRPIVSSSHPLATFIMVSTGGTCPPS